MDNLFNNVSIHDALDTLNSQNDFKKEMINVCDIASTNISYVINDSAVVNKSMRPSSVGSNCLMHDSPIQGNSL